MGKKEDAVRSFNTAISLEGNNPTFYHEKAIVLKDLNRKEEAIISYE